MNLTGNWQFWALLAAVFAAMTAILAKVGVDGMDPDSATFVRTLVIAVLVAAGLGASGKLGALTSISGRAFFWLMLSGAATGAPWICYFRALKIGQASQVAPVDKLSVVFVAVLGVFVLGETLGVQGCIGVAMIGGGALLLATG